MCIMQSTHVFTHSHSLLRLVSHYQQGCQMVILIVHVGNNFVHKTHSKRHIFRKQHKSLGKNAELLLLLLLILYTGWSNKVSITLSLNLN